MRIRLMLSTAMLLMWGHAAAVRAVPAVAYEVPAGAVGNQAFGGSLGMDFNADAPVLVTQLGVFDSASDGLNLPITARLWDRATQAELANIPFSTGGGALVGGSRFAPLGAPVVLPAGFQGTIAAEGYGAAEMNGNGGGVPFAGSTTNGAGALSFVGSSRFGAAGAFPGSADGGPANRYGAGTFVFEPLDVAYLVPAGTTGNQAFDGALGMDFDVNTDSTISALGVFDSAQDGLTRTIVAQVYDRANPAQPLRTVVFQPGDGTLIGGSRFVELETALDLPAGFQGTIVAQNYGAAEPNGNGGGVPFAGSTTFDGGGDLSFVGAGRFGSFGRFPGTADGGPANRYGAGTFAFGDITSIDIQAESPDKVAYLVIDGTVGNQAFDGSLGMDFDVNEPIEVTQLGVFDSAQDGLNLTITAHLYDRDNPASPLATLTFSPGDDGVLENGSRFKDLPAILELPAGFHGTIVAEGYGAAELLGNEGVGDIAITTNNGGGLLSFVGASRFGTAGSFPASVDGGPANRYAAGTFRFEALTPIPEPGTAAMLAIGLAAFARRRRTRRMA